jgi:transcriptional regulator with XRE-family HTH domain
MANMNSGAHPIPTGADHDFDTDVDLDEWMIADDDPDVAPVVVTDDEPTRRAHESGERLADFSSRSTAWTCMYRASDDGEFATDWAFHSRRLAVLMNHRARMAQGDSPPGAMRLGYYVRALREARGLSRIELAAANDRAAIDPVAIMLVEHGHLSREELGPVFLSRLGIAMGTPLSTLEALRDNIDVAATTQPAATAVAAPVRAFQGVGAWLTDALGAILPQSSAYAVALGNAPSAAVKEEELSYAIDGHPLSQPIPLLATTVLTHDGNLLTLDPILVPETPALPGVCGVEVGLRDPAGTPIVGQRIRLTIHDTPGIDEPVAATGTDGIARFHHVSVGAIRQAIAASESGTASDPSPFTLVFDS